MAAWPETSGPRDAGKQVKAAMDVDHLDKEKQLGLKKVLSMKTVEKKTEKREEETQCSTI